MNKKHIPIRMCIICKKRLSKILLNKFPLNFLKPTSTKRSFYICNDCIGNENLIKKILNKNFKIKNYDLKGEFNGKCSN